MPEPKPTLKQVVDYCQDHELLLRLVGIAETEIIRHHSIVHSRPEDNNRRQTIDDTTRKVMAELISVGILKLELNQDKRFLFPGETWNNRVAILSALPEQ